MRRSPSIVPQSAAHDTYLVLNDFGRLGRAWCEADERAADRKALIRRLMEAQYSHPVRIVAFNTAEGWSQDVSSEIAQERRRRCELQMRDVPSSIQDFVERHEGCDRQLTLRLA